VAERPGQPAALKRMVTPQVRVRSFDANLGDDRALPVLLKRRHIDNEAVLHVPFEKAFVSLVDLLNFDQFDIGSDAVIGAEIEHLLSFLDAADA
jgi:hypothetical protein